MLSQITLLALASSAFALQITSPEKNQLWDLSKSNEIKWNAVNTDPQTFDIYLSHMASHPPTNTLLIADANKDAGSFTVKDLQLPIGTTYQINFVAHNKPEQIYAQSQQFNTTGEAVAATSTLDGYTGPTYSPSASGAAASDSAETTSSRVSGSSVTRTTLRTLTTTSGSATITQTTAATTTEDANAATTASAQGSGSAAGAASASATRPASGAVANGASAPLAALVFGIAAFFL